MSDEDVVSQYAIFQLKNMITLVGDCRYLCELLSLFAFYLCLLD